ncbi:MAG: protoporphyrinogen oxidase [Chloroflexota bacterium]
MPTRLRPFALSPLISPLGKLRMGLDLVIPARRDEGDESVADFVRRRLGNEALDKIAEPLMGGIHVSDPERQSVLSTFPRFREIERKHGSLVRGMVAGRHSRPTNGKALPLFMTLRDGLQEIPEALSKRLDGTRMLLGRSAVRLDKEEAGPYRLTLDDGGRLTADAVVLAVPARNAATLVEGLDGELSAHLRTLRYVTTATVSLAYRRWTSTKFNDRAPADSVLLRCFLGGAVDQSSALLPEDEMVRVARAEVASLMGITAEPALTRVFRWRDAHPQYDVGHHDFVAEVERLQGAHPGLYLTGSSYRGVGLPDCIHSGTLVAEKVLEKAYPRLSALPTAN